jgi:hypothetical protein
MWQQLTQQLRQVTKRRNGSKTFSQYRGEENIISKMELQYLPGQWHSTIDLGCAPQRQKTSREHCNNMGRRR